ncbi:uncharacterized protein Dvar_62530 [Desulfosarcina variabilis str. Montpellier]|uniref:hypothetical protein n=1 Tax=Desulfosarcina variabilis TaxID=2300 RepID=UPI003AFA206D
MKMRRILGLLLGIALVLPLPIETRAEQENDENYKLENIIVSEEGEAVPEYKKTVVSEEDVGRPSLSSSV